MILLALLLTTAQAQPETPPAEPPRPALEVVDGAAQEDALRARREAEAAGRARPPSDLGAADSLDRARRAFASGDLAAALLFAEAAGVAGEVEGAALAGLIHAEGAVATASDAAAVRWFSFAAGRGLPGAVYELGLLARDARGGLSPAEAPAFFRRAAEAGHVRAMLAHALVLRDAPVPQEARRALEWAERAANAGDAEAMFQLAQLSGDWNEGPRDLEAARHWYARAAAAGHAEAALQAGLMAASGEGGPVDPEAALRLVSLSAEAGFAPAEGQYGLMLYQGWNGADPSPAEAAAWFRRGAQGGDAEARFYYALVLARGEGVTPDTVEAYYWTLLAAVEADGTAYFNADRDRLQRELEAYLPGDLAQGVRLRVAGGG